MMALVKIYFLNSMSDNRNINPSREAYGDYYRGSRPGNWYYPLILQNNFAFCSKNYGAVIVNFSLSAIFAAEKLLSLETN